MFEIQHYTLCNGWLNTWTIEQDGEFVPKYFNTREEAESFFIEFLNQEHEAFREGCIDSMYAEDEFRIVEVKNANL